MTTFRYQSPRVDEEAAYLDLNLPNVAVDDFVFMPQLDSYPADSCDSIDFSKFDIPLDDSLWDNFNPDLFTSTTEPSFPASASTSNDFWSADINSLPDPSSICFDIPQTGHASPNDFSPDTTFAETALPTADSDDSSLRLNWVRSTLKDLALTRAAKDTRPVSQKTKRIDASIELYLQLQNDFGTGFQEQCDPTSQTMVWQHSSTSTTGSSFDNNSFSLTGSPVSSTSTVPELSPRSCTRAGSASAGPSTVPQPSATGGVQMILDMNLNETTSLPRKHRPKTQEERQRYIAVRRQGACDWHRKQRKRCTCVDKTDSTATTVKRKQLMKHVQNVPQHSPGAAPSVSARDRWRKTDVRPSHGPLESWLTQDDSLIPKLDLRHCGGQECNDPQCPECCCPPDDPVTHQLLATVRASDARLLHKPYTNCGTHSLIERQPWGEPLDYSQGRGPVVHSPSSEILQTRSETQAPILPHSQITTRATKTRWTAQDLDVHIIASPGRPSPVVNTQPSVGDMGETQVCSQKVVYANSTPTRRRLDTPILALAAVGAPDSLPNARLMPPRSDNANLLSFGVGVEVSRHMEWRLRSQNPQLSCHTPEPRSAEAYSIVRLVSTTIAKLATHATSTLCSLSTSSQRCHSYTKRETPPALANKPTSCQLWPEQSTNFHMTIPWLLLVICGCVFFSPILSFALFTCLRSVASSDLSSSQLARIMERIRTASIFANIGSQLPGHHSILARSKPYLW
ncbi:hypothetical protein AJ78_05005 [Emergomyces pasteurianus Ep9510]|uniref:Uncharacterized protein n=1 Tax=Emergomyces pasteurianus Ep9510 TaxID=1447872 RepID=A0A1J9PDU2_9EURO|nr:hypothetical protein AJ78_05005 [Emergomyces pasteurianus Ep9510]